MARPPFFENEVHRLSPLSASRRVALTLVALALLMGACRADVASGPANAAALVHVHGLQPVPGSEGLYVATHSGLFRVEDGKIEAVGEAAHDLMGFTVAGPGDLLASGHPDMRDDALLVEGKPPLLGLVQSTDGTSWKARSLLGEADFHALVAAHDQVYGLDSQTGALMVSADRETWETRSEGLPFIDLAVSPDDPDRLVATTQAGVMGSDDGGRSWTEVAAQRGAFLSWNDEGLFGVSPEGAVLRSDDGGQSWQSLGRVEGVPEAFVATGGAIYVAVHEAGIVRSVDGGATFELLVRTGGDT
jgi:hypothetical protein